METSLAEFKAQMLEESRMVEDDIIKRFTGLLGEHFDVTYLELEGQSAQ
jgi:hypothetical protein